MDMVTSSQKYDSNRAPRRSCDQISPERWFYCVITDRPDFADEVGLPASKAETDRQIPALY
jgi:hypothetical protein